MRYDDEGLFSINNHELIHEFLEVLLNGCEVS